MPEKKIKFLYEGQAATGKKDTTYSYKHDPVSWDTIIPAGRPEVVLETLLKDFPWKTHGTVSIGSDFVDFEIFLTDRTNKKVGKIAFTCANKDNPDNFLTPHRDLYLSRIDIAKRLQARGSGKMIMGNMIDLSDLLGYEGMGLMAADEVGPYVWLKYGGTATDMSKIMMEIKLGFDEIRPQLENSKTGDATTRIVEAVLRSRHPMAPRIITELKNPEVLPRLRIRNYLKECGLEQTTTPGKAIIMGRSWDGRIGLETGSMSRQICEAYLSGQERDIYRSIEEAGLKL